jgi:DNA-binding NtrC family response regulator
MSCGVLSRAAGWSRFLDVRNVNLRGNNLQSRRTKAAATRRLSRKASEAHAPPHRDLLAREFSNEVAAAVEAAIASRTRLLMEKGQRIAPNGAGRRPGPTDERWPTLEEHQWSYINRVLERTQGNKSEAAAMLGLHRRSLQRLLRRNKGAARPAARRRRPEAHPASPQQIVTGDGTIVLESLTFSEIERAILAWALQRHEGSGRQAARSLGLARSTFADKVNRYALKGPRPAKRRAATR